MTALPWWPDFVIVFVCVVAIGWSLGRLSAARKMRRYRDRTER